MKTQPESPSPAGRSAHPMRGLVAALLTVAVLALAYGLREIGNHLDRIETTRLDHSQALSREIETLQTELQDIRSDLNVATQKAGAADELADRLRFAESRLGDIGEVIEAQASSLSSLEEEREVFGPQTLERELDERDARLLHRWETLSQLVSSAKETADESLEELESLSAQLEVPRDLERMWREIVGPVVQLAGDTSIGSGVLLHSVQDTARNDFRTYLVTAWHVVRDIQGDLSRTDMPVPVHIYSEDGSIRNEKAKLLCFDPNLDAALLELHTPDALENGARMASHERLADIRIFDPIYAVGCPLGNDPIPTNGEIATAHHEVDGELYWMINAPTYIGNSGGGIFDSKTHELLGIFSKIYTHGTLRPTIVPHMGLVTPMSAIYSWLEEQGYDLVANAPIDRKQVAAVR